MAKPKIKLDVKGFLLRKGEVLAMGVAGFCLVVLLLWGASKWSSAKDPNEIAKGLADQSNRVTAGIEKGEPKAEDLDAIKPQDFIVKPVINKPATTSAFPWHGPVFDPTAQPNTKRENPVVFNVTDYQVDLTRSAMPGYDIIFDGNDEALIAVLAIKEVGKLDEKKLKETSKQLLKMAERKSNRRGPAPKAPPPPPRCPPAGCPPAACLRAAACFRAGAKAACMAAAPTVRSAASTTPTASASTWARSSSTSRSRRSTRRSRRGTCRPSPSSRCGWSPSTRSCRTSSSSRRSSAPCG